MTEAADTRRPGRPRSAEAHAAILRAAVELAATDGLRGLSMEAIAARAGVGKATIYRRWKTKEDAVRGGDALDRAVIPDVPDTGTVRGDLDGRGPGRVGRLSTDAFRVSRGCMAEAGDDPALREALDEALLRPRRAAHRRDPAPRVARGELRDDLDVDLVTEMLIGAARHPHAHVGRRPGRTRWTADARL